MISRSGQAPPFPDEARFLVIETGFVGDVLVTTPALRAIRAAYPKSRITAAVRPASGLVLVGNPNVARLLPLKREDRSGALAVLRIASWIRAQRFDAAFVFRPSFRSALLPALGGVPVRAGLATEGRGFLLTHRARCDAAESEVEKNLRVVWLLGIAPDGRELEMFPTDEERVRASELLKRVGRRPVVGIHPGANWEIRQWPTERFAELGARLRDEADVVYFLGPREGGMGETLRDWHLTRALPEPVIVFPESVRVLAAALESVDVAVANNSGPMHVASAVGVEGVFIHGPTPVERWHLPDRRHTDVYARGLGCRPCDSTRCVHERILCLENISVDDVYEAVVERLRGDAESAAAPPAAARAQNPPVCGEDAAARGDGAPADEEGAQG